MRINVPSHLSCQIITWIVLDSTEQELLNCRSHFYSWSFWHCPNYSRLNKEKWDSQKSSTCLKYCNFVEEKFFFKNCIFSGLFYLELNLKKIKTACLNSDSCEFVDGQAQNESYHNFICQPEYLSYIIMAFSRLHFTYVQSSGSALNKVFQ